MFHSPLYHGNCWNSGFEFLMLAELSFAAVYLGEEYFVNCSGELNPMISTTENIRVAACWSMGLPHLIVALGALRHRAGRAGMSGTGLRP